MPQSQDHPVFRLQKPMEARGFKLYLPQKGSWENTPDGYPTFQSSDEMVSICVDPTDIFVHKGNVWVGDRTDIRPDKLTVTAIITKPEARGKHLASQALEQLQAAALEVGITLSAEPVSMKDKTPEGEKALSTQQLREWYRRHGWKQREKGSDQILEYGKPMSKQASHVDQVVKLRSHVRAIATALRLRPVLTSDPLRQAEIEDRIRRLPSAEDISNMKEADLINFRSLLDRLMYEMDSLENNRSVTNAIQYQHRTGLPTARAPLTAAYINPVGQPGHQWRAKLWDRGQVWRSPILSDYRDAKEWAETFQVPPLPRAKRRVRGRITCDGKLYQLLADRIVPPLSAGSAGSATDWYQRAKTEEV